MDVPTHSYSSSLLRILYKKGGTNLLYFSLQVFLTDHFTPCWWSPASCQILTEHISRTGRLWEIVSQYCYHILVTNN